MVKQKNYQGIRFKNAAVFLSSVSFCGLKTCFCDCNLPAWFVSLFLPSLLGLYSFVGDRWPQIEIPVSSSLILFLKSHIRT